MLPLTVALWVAALINLAVIAVADLRRRIIPNELVLATVAAGITLRLVSVGGGLWLSLGGATVIFLTLGAIAHLGVIGGGDVKLISAASLLVSANQVPSLLLDVAMAGGVLSAAYLVARLARGAGAAVPVRPAASESAGPARTLARTILTGTVPYGLAIFMGVAFYSAHEALRCLSATSCSF